jgi:hypothetical protein
MGKTVVTPSTGVKDLRVINASIILLIISSNRNILTIAIAADLIKKNFRDLISLRIKLNQMSYWKHLKFQY